MTRALGEGGGRVGQVAAPAGGGPMPPGRAEGSPEAQPRVALPQVGPGRAGEGIEPGGEGAGSPPALSGPAVHAGLCVVGCPRALGVPQA